MIEHCILTAGTSFDKPTPMTDPANSTTNAKTSIADAFRGPSSGASPRKIKGLRIPVDSRKPLSVLKIEPMGWAAYWGLLFPNATVIQLGGKLNVVLRIYPAFVQIEKRKWTHKSALFGRFAITIPVFDEIGDEAKHQIRIRSELAFLYPFVPMHVEVAIDDEVVFGQGKFDILARSASE